MIQVTQRAAGSAGRPAAAVEIALGAYLLLNCFSAPTTVQLALLREFTDTNGICWRVWDVNPALDARAVRRAKRRSLEVPECWLCFEAERQHRRMSPIPSDWTSCDELTLEAYCAEAQPVRGHAPKG